MPEFNRLEWFQKEVQPHEPLLRSYLIKKFPTLDDVDDVIQEAYARLFKSCQESEIRQPKAFLFSISRNLVYDKFRRSNIVQFESLASFSESFVSDSRSDVSESVSRRDEVNLIMEAVQSLPKRCRQIMTLRVIYGLSYKEIAAKMEISNHTVKAQISRGIRKVSKYLAKHEVTAETLKHFGG